MFRTLFIAVTIVTLIAGCTSLTPKDKPVTISYVMPLGDRATTNEANSATFGALGGQIAGMFGAPIIGVAAGGVAAGVIGNAAENITAKPNRLKIVYWINPDTVGTKRGTISHIQKPTPESLNLKPGDKAIFIEDADGDLILVPYRAKQ